MAELDWADEIEIHWRAYLLDPTATAEPKDLESAIDRKYGPGAFGGMVKRLGALGEAEGITYRFDKALRVSTLDAHRLLAWAWAVGGNVRACDAPDCSRSGATTTTSPNSFITRASAFSPGARTPSSLVIRIRGRAGIAGRNSEKRAKAYLGKHSMVNENRRAKSSPRVRPLPRCHPEFRSDLMLNWSGRPDLNRRPLAPHASALPGCATPRPNFGFRA